ncbi:MAG: FtsH protease activity modulator HflK [Sphingomonadales bacterium]|jgi:membrane protease subunit HflK
MPWENNSGGGNGGRNPWGQGPRGGGGQRPPDIDDIIRQGQKKLQKIVPGGVGGGRGIVLIILAVILLIAAVTSFYRVDTGEQGVVLRFGKYVRSEAPGLHLKLPAPLETVITPNVERVNSIDVGFRQQGQRASQVELFSESLMLTGDENIIDINFTIFWRIKPEDGAAGKFLFNIQPPQEVTVKDVAESAMREVIGQTRLQDAITGARGRIEIDVQKEIQEVLDSYDSGIQITEVKLEKVDPPAAVIDAFRDVQAAEADQVRRINEAQAYANDILPKAKGQAQQVMQKAEGYKAEVVNRAQGEASRFLAVYGQYAQAKDVTRRRIYLETMEDILQGMDKIIVDQSAGQGVVPYLPLPEVEKRRN